MEQNETQAQTQNEILQTQMREEAQLSIAMNDGNYAAMVKHQRNLESLKPLLVLSEIADGKARLKQIEIERAEIVKKKENLEDVLKQRNAEFVKASKVADDLRQASQSISVALFSLDGQDENLLDDRRQINENISNCQKKIFAEGKGKEETHNN